METKSVVKEQTPYLKMVAALVAANARRLAVIDGPNTKKSGAPKTTWSELEFWACPTPKPGRLVIIQRWLDSGGFDAYVPIASHMTSEAIKEVLGEAPISNSAALLQQVSCELGQMGFNDPDQSIDGGDCCEYLGKLFHDIDEALERDGLRAAS